MCSASTFLCLDICIQRHLPVLLIHPQYYCGVYVLLMVLCQTPGSCYDGDVNSRGHRGGGEVEPKFECVQRKTYLHV